MTQTCIRRSSKVYLVTIAYCWKDIILALTDAADMYNIDNFISFLILLHMLNPVLINFKSIINFFVIFFFIQQSYTSLKDALRVCAAFRGCYLDKKDRADETNHQRLSEQSGTK